MGENNVVGMQFEKAEKVTVIVWVEVDHSIKGIDLFKRKWRKDAVRYLFLP